MKKVLLAVATAVLGSAFFAGGSAQADVDRYRLGVLATGFTYCQAGDLAAFPATNVGRRKAWVKVSCVNAEGEEFFEFDSGDTGPVKVKLGGGEAVLLAKVCEAPVDGIGGELVRCTVKGRHWVLEQMRGVLHICEPAESTDLQLLGCDLTEALSFSADDEDD